MKNKILIFIKKQWLLIWCSVIAMSLLTMGISAEYAITASTMKRVVRSVSDQGKMFSSNILVENGDNAYSPSYQAENSSGTYSIDVFLWNYSLSNILKYYPGNIDYNITLEFTKKNGTSISADVIGERKVSLVKFDDAVSSDNDEPSDGEDTLDDDDALIVIDSSHMTGSTVEKQTLEYNSSIAAEHHYYLVFSGNWDLDTDSDICVKMKATPDKGGDNSKYQDISEISAIIGLKRNSDIGSSGWEAYIEEKDKIAINNCDAYNLIAEGAGKAVITIKWNTDYLSCNKYFADDTVYSLYSFGTYIYMDNTDPENIQYTPMPEVEYTKHEGESKIDTLVIIGDTDTILVNEDTPDLTDISSNTELENRNRYDIQFYKTANAKPNSWSFVTDDEDDLGEGAWLYINVEQQ